MFTKTEKLIKYLELRCLQPFEILCTEEADILRHSETINGIQVQSTIYIDNSVCTEIVYSFAQCPYVMKRDDVILFLNELNCQRKLKYCLSDDGSVCALLHYWADDESFDCDNMLSLYASFMKSITQNSDVNKIMRIIWG